MTQFKIWGSHSGADDDSSLPICYVMLTGKELWTFWMIEVPSFSVSHCFRPTLLGYNIISQTDFSLHNTIYLHIPSYTSGYTLKLHKKLYYRLSLTSIDLESTENLLDWEVHNCWILFHKECVFCESLKQIKLCKRTFTLHVTLQYVLNVTGHLLLDDDAECYQSYTTAKYCTTVAWQQHKSTPLHFLFWIIKTP